MAVVNNVREMGCGKWLRCVELLRQGVTYSVTPKGVEPSVQDGSVPNWRYVTWKIPRFNGVITRLISGERMILVTCNYCQQVNHHRPSSVGTIRRCTRCGYRYEVPADYHKVKHHAHPVLVVLLAVMVVLLCVIITRDKPKNNDAGDVTRITTNTPAKKIDTTPLDRTLTGIAFTAVKNADLTNKWNENYLGKITKLAAKELALEREIVERQATYERRIKEGIVDNRTNIIAMEKQLANLRVEASKLMAEAAKGPKLVPLD